MQRHAEQCDEICCVFAQNFVSQLKQVATHCSVDHHLKNYVFETVGEPASACALIALKRLYLASQQWTTRHLVDSKHFRKEKHKVESGVRQKGWQYGSVTFITLQIIDNIVMLVIKPVIASQAYFKTHIARETCSNFRHPLQVACCAFWAIEISSQLRECVRNKLQHRTAAPRLKSFPSTQDCEWKKVTNVISFGMCCRRPLQSRRNSVITIIIKGRSRKMGRVS